MNITDIMMKSYGHKSANTVYNLSTLYVYRCRMKVKMCCSNESVGAKSVPSMISNKAIFISFSSLFSFIKTMLF